MKYKIFSGIRPSGKLHLGNYLGAIKNWLALQSDPQTEQAIFAVVDYHGITTPFNPQTYPQQVKDTVLDYLAAGIDPTKSLLIRQSHVPEHTELAWILNTITPVSWLDRLPTYEEKIKETKGQYTHLGLLAYPVLMAADILIYQSNLVPVGDDQKAHIDLTNEVAKKFNHLFGETFASVKIAKAEGERIKSLQNPTQKMSKSGDGGLALTDDPDTIREKIKKAVTDSDKNIVFDEKNKPALSNLLTIYRLLSGQEIKELERKYAGRNYTDFKKDLAEVTVEFLRPFQQKRQELVANFDQVKLILTKAEEKARALAGDTLAEVKKKIGV